MARDVIQSGTFTILDGGMGTMLQKAGLAPGQRPEAFLLQNPEAITAIHRAYIEAGSDIVYANTFGANRHKLAGTGLAVEEVIRTAVACAKRACEGTGVRVALDVGPLGELLEPTGTMKFEQAVELFAEMMRLGEAAGADLIAIETMTDLYECKAAVLAARENSALPVIASMSFEETGRTFSGTPIEAMAATLSPLGPVALGINCSLGPAAIMPLARRLCAATRLPVFVKPNAGMPDPATGAYSLSDEAFAEQMAPCLAMGVSMVGGCCGTTPDTIRALVTRFKGQTPAPRQTPSQSLVCSGTRVVTVEGVTPIGERLNPTGKKRMQQALTSGDWGYLQALAVEQQRGGAQILGLNVGVPGVDEVEMLPLAVKAVQSVTDLPLQLDSTNIDALAAALRVYNGKPVLNSTSGEQAKMNAVLPLCKAYGTALVCLTLDEAGIPDTPEGRLAIARRIMERALALGIARENLWIDTLVLTASAQPEAPEITLRALELVKKELGLKTLLGVSNVSFGLPNRPLINQTFLAMALEAGLDLPIINPNDEQTMDLLSAFALLKGRDENAAVYVARQQQEGKSAAAPAADTSVGLGEAISRGLKEQAVAGTKALLAEGRPGMEIVEAFLMPALDEAGRGFEDGSVFLPQLLATAGAAQGAFEVIRQAMGEGASDGPVVVLATVQGDIHDIGKNIARVLLENYGYRVVDLGRDVPPETVAEAAKKNAAGLVGLSALMTTTLPAMQKTIQLLREQTGGCRVMVGGAVLTEEYARKIGADFFAKDAQKGIEIARTVFGGGA